MSLAPIEQTSPTSPGIPLETQPPHRSELQRIWRRFSANRLAMIGMAFIIALCIMAVFADVIAPYDPTESFAGQRGGTPTWEHPLGFDHIGRDMLSRVIYGARVALIVGLVATFLAVLIGVLVGAVAGFYGNWVDVILSRILDTLMAIPILALLIVLAAILGPSLITTIVVIGATAWARFARVVRADVMSARERDYVIAARASGMNNTRIIWRHVLPNVLGPVIVLASLGVGTIIILESALSFLGLGIQPPTPSWGRTLSDGRAFITLYPHIAIAPGVMIVLTVLAFNFIGDGLRDALDPHQK